MQPRPKTKQLPSLSGVTSLDRLRRLYDIVRSLNSIIRLDRLLNRIVAAAAEMLEARGAALLLADPQGRSLTFEVTSGRVSSQLKGMVVPLNDHNLVGQVALRGVPYIENDALQGASLALQLSPLGGYGGHSMQKLICVPLRVQDRAIGVLMVLDKVSGADFGHDDIQLLEALADAAAVAVENVRLYEEERAKAQLLAKAYDELQTTYNATLQALTGLLDTRDTSTYGHSERVVAFALRLAREMGIDDEARLRALEHGALLHDVGKIGVPDAVLRKPGPLDEDEWREMKSHPDLGYRMLKEIEFLQDAIPVVRYHHEHWDGSGYPLGLKGLQIPLEARVFAVVDAFDALTSERPYSKARNYEEATVVFFVESGKSFDPAVVEAFLRVPKEEWQAIRDRIAAGKH